jgi:isoaspartyl peptidase/L-asparaginase-like protein (Ntn-hydrolase superfamily)
MADYVAIATWRWGETAVKTAAPLLDKGSLALDAALAGAQAVEDDPKVNSVGYAGLPNSVGTVQLDASVMDGATLNCGAVAAVENIRHPAALARLVMEKTPHILLVGAGAKEFALQNGFTLEVLLTPESLAQWERDRPRRVRPMRPAQGKDKEPSHDTVTVLALDKNNSLGGVCTTSGLAYKLPGRAGDSPLIGHGLYVDNTAGAAGGTGIGEEIIRIGGSLTIVEAMRSGKSPQEACELAIRKVNTVAARRGVHPARMAFIALDRKGEVGAACTEGTNFPYAVARPGKVEMLKGAEVKAML